MIIDILMMCVSVHVLSNWYLEINIGGVCVAGGAAGFSQM